MLSVCDTRGQLEWSVSYLNSFVLIRFRIDFIKFRDTQYDGLEYRFISEIARHLNIVHVMHNSRSYEEGPKQLVQDECDLTMCSMWMSEEHHKQFDMTDFIDFQCGTFFVRRPTKVPSSSYIFLSLSLNVWMSLLGSLLLVAVLQTVFDRIQPTSSRKIYSDVARSFLDVTSVMTGHGVPLILKNSASRLLVLR